MRLRVDVDTLSTVSTYGLAKALKEREKAHAKHASNSIEGTHDPLTFLAILMEEVGEVAHALTYDAANPEELETEIAQVMAVAWAWVDSLGRSR